MALDTNRIIDIMVLYAEQLLNDAEMSGSRDDGGSGIVRRQIAIYQAGVLQLVPTEWKRVIKENTKADDPEYKEYMRLKEKFEQ